MHLDCRSFLVVIVGLISVPRVSRSLNLFNITGKINFEGVSGTVAVFADFNADKATDILILNDTGVGQRLYTWSGGKNQFEPVSLDFHYPAVAARAGDFDGDGVLDLLWKQASDGDCSPVFVTWLTMSTEEERVPVVANTTWIFNSSTSPSLLMATDVDGDHISDVLSATCGHPQVPTAWISKGKNRAFQSETLEVRRQEGRDEGPIRGYNYVDLSSDCIPELLSFRNGVGGVLDLWRWQDGKLTWSQNVSLNISSAASVVGPPTVIDLNGDGVSELVFFVCYNGSEVCWNTSLLVVFPVKYPESDVMNCKGSTSWQLSFHKTYSLELTQPDRHLGVAMSVVSTQPALGNLDLDNSPDMLLPITDLRFNITYLLLLSGSSDGSFVPQWNDMKDLVANDTRTVHFFDFHEDGILDTLLQHGSGEVSAFKHSLGADRTFLKALVLEGFCYSNCSARILPYGSVLSSASVGYLTTSRSGHTQMTVATPKSSSAPLQLPFILFGLGETPNFIEKITVGTAIQVAGNGGNYTIEVRFRSWRNLVPNSQVIVIPTPLNSPDSWHLLLYLTPSHLVFTTIGVLCGLAAGLAVLIILLQAREKYQDSQERKQAKHKFHFNAM